MPSIDNGPIQTESHVEDLTGNNISDGKTLLDSSLETNEEEQENKKDKGKSIRIEDEPPNELDVDGWLDILGSGELKKKVLKAGKGVESRPPRGSWITANLEGKLEDETVVEKEEAFRFILGDCEVVQGLDVAVALMEEGEDALIIVPARLAYGKQGRSPNIPPHSNLTYKVELLKVEEAGEEKELPLSQRLSVGDLKRDRGNFWYSRGEFSNAIHCYRRSLEFLDDYDQNLEEEASELQKLLDMRLKVYNNLGAAQIKIEAFDAALKSVENVLMVQPQNVKALFRKGKILASKNQTDEAITVLRKAKELEPDSKIIHQELGKLVGKQRSYEKEEKAMYRKMFPTFSENNSEKKSGQTKVRQWLQRFGLLLGSVLMVVLGAAVYKHLNTSH